MTTNAPINLSTSAGHAADYLGRANSIPHRTEGESAFLEFIPVNTRLILDLGTGDGRLLALVKSDLSRPESAPDIDPEVAAMAVDFSPAMLEAVRKRFAADSFVTIVADNLDHPLPALGKFDAIVSSLAIHHLLHERKRASFMPRFTGLLNLGGVFCNLEHVASPSPRLHEQFLHNIGYTVETEDPSNKLLDVETQLRWLREIGFVDVDCHWKWRELALLVGRRE